MIRLAFILMLLLTLAVPAAADTVHLRREARIAGPGVKLGDIASLEGEIVQALSEIVVAEFSGSTGELQVSQARVREMLDARKVNWGLVTLRGPVQIRVLRESQARPDAPGNPDFSSGSGGLIEGVAVANPTRPVSIHGIAQAPQWALPQAVEVETVRDRIRKWISTQLSASGDELRLDFQDHPVLNEPTDGPRLELEPLSRSFLGRLPVQVRRYTADGRSRTDQIVVHVSRRTQAVVASRSLGRGAVLDPADVQIREIWVNASTAETIGSIEAVAGRKLRGGVSAGSLIVAGDLEDAVAVKRGQMVTVRCLSGGLVLRMTARAMESGEVGQWIQFKNEQNRQLFKARVSGLQEAVIALDEVASSQKEGQIR